MWQFRNDTKTVSIIVSPAKTWIQCERIVGGFWGKSKYSWQFGSWSIERWPMTRRYKPNQHGFGWVHTLDNSPFSPHEAREFWVPTWAVFLLATMPVSLIIGKRLLGRRFQVGRCRRCGYDLRATPQRCPECGMVIQTKRVAKSL
jgi:hypothetical protein